MIRLPVIEGVIRRRILVNFRVDPEVMKRQLPARFQPKLHNGHAIAGICLIRLESIRPRGLPAFMGISSENAAHRIAVTWEENGESHEGVFIPRRDTGSWMNEAGGGRVFPGEHHRARFSIRENPDELDLSMRSDDGTTAVEVSGRFGGGLPESSCFADLADASVFFEPGALGYSVTSDPNRLDGITLHTKEWRVEALQVTNVSSTYFAALDRFPRGTAQFDCALAMRNLAHEWRTAADLRT